MHFGVCGWGLIKLLAQSFHYQDCDNEELESTQSAGFSELEDARCVLVNEVQNWEYPLRVQLNRN